MATQIRDGEFEEFRNGERIVTQPWYSDEPTRGLAIADVGILVGATPPGDIDSGLRAVSVRAARASNGSGHVVTVQYSDNRPSAGDYQPFSPIVDLDVYAYSIGFERQVDRIPEVRTQVTRYTDASGSKTQQTTWAPPEFYDVPTKLQRITLETGATTAQLGLGNGTTADLATVRAISAFDEKLVTLDNTQYLFRVARIQQSTSTRGNDASSARWNVTYELVYDPGQRAQITDFSGFVELTNKNALAQFRDAGGSTPNDQGVMIPFVASPYTNGPPGKWQRPPYSTVTLRGDSVADPSFVIEAAPKFVARPKYESVSGFSWMALPGVPS